MHSQLSRHSTARGSSTGLVPIGPTKVKAPTSVLFTEGTLEVEIKGTLSIHLDICVQAQQNRVGKPQTNFKGASSKGLL